MQYISSDLSGVIASSEKVPISRIEIFDTTYTVPSSGFFVRYFSGVDQNANGAVKRTQFEPIAMKDWSNGLPVELSNYVGAKITNSGLLIANPFSVSFSGYFYADSSGLYNFTTRAAGGTELFIDGVQVLSGFQMITPTTTGYSSGYWAGKNFTWNGSAGLNTGWHDITAKYYWFSQTGINTQIVDTPFFSAFYSKPPSGTQTPISASVVNIYKQFITPTNLTNVIFASEQVDENQASQFSFEVSVPYSGLYTWSRQNQDFGFLKINRLCKIYNGYVTESGYFQTSGYTTNLAACTDFVPKFQGFIDDVIFDQSATSVTATVKCRDFFKRAISAINDNFPNHANYFPSIVNFLDAFKTFSIDQNMPNAYDNWSLFDVMTILAINAGIDPSKINRAKWDTQNFFKLESNLNWPSTDTVDANGVVTKDGDPFLFKFNYGEDLFTEMKKISDLVGYRSFFDEVGDLVFLDPRRTNRVEIYETGNYASKSIAYTGDWKITVDINASNRFYTSPINRFGGFSTGIASMSFSGVGLGVYQFNHSSGNTYRVDIYDQNPNLVYSSYFSNSGTLTYGVEQEITRNLPLGSYNAYIYPSGDVRIEGFEYYTQNIFKPVYTFREDRDITNLSIDLNDITLRNEVIAVGQQESDKGYIYSKAIDLDSISNPASFNYVGQKRTFVIIEPTIQSQSRLNWLANSVLQKYRRKQRNITVTTQGLPHIQIGDPVGINSSFANLSSDSNTTWDINNNDVYYVNALTSNITQGKYTSTFTLTSLKPVDSWRPPTPINNDMLLRIYSANNNTIFANFKQLTLNATSGYGYDGFSNQAAFVSFDLLVSVDRMWALISDEQGGGKLFEYIDTKSKSPILTYQTSHNQDPNNGPQGAVWLYNGGSETWGNITVPTAQNTFNGGQWIGQNSQGNVRTSGVYPIAIWAQFTTADNSKIYQGIWVPLSGTLDNRNRVLSNTSTSSGNIYYQYTGGPNLQTIFSAAGPGIAQAYLPGFAVSDADFLIDAWIGPVESGYQIITQNKLATISGFDNFNSTYTNAAVQTPFDSLSTNISVVKPSPTDGRYMEAGTYPFSPGTPVVKSGNVLNAIPGVSNGTVPVSIPQAYEYIYKNFSNRSSSNMAQDAFSWAFQGVNWIGKPAYSKQNLPSFVRPYNSGYESIFHEFNPIVIKANHDFYLTVQTCLYRANIGAWLSPGNFCPTCLQDFTEIPMWSATSQQVIHGPIAIYPTDRLINDGIPGLNLQGTPYPFGASVAFQLYNGTEPDDWKQTAGYHLTYNVFYPAYLSPPETPPAFNGEDYILTKYMFTEAKSGRKFYFTVRWSVVNSHDMFGYYNMPHAILGNHRNIDYLRVL